MFTMAARSQKGPFARAAREACVARHIAGPYFVAKDVWIALVDLGCDDALSALGSGQRDRRGHDRSRVGTIQHAVRARTTGDARQGTEPGERDDDEQASRTQPPHERTRDRDAAANAGCSNPRDRQHRLILDTRATRRVALLKIGVGSREHRHAYARARAIRVMRRVAAWRQAPPAWAVRDARVSALAVDDIVRNTRIVNRLDAEDLVCHDEPRGRGGSGVGQRSVRP